MDDTAGDNKTLVTIIAVALIAVVVVAGIGFSAKNKSSKSSNSSSSASISQAGSSANSAASSNATYKDGAYTGSNSFDTPGGVASISTTVTLKNGLISTVDTTVNPADGESQAYSDSFTSGYRSEVVGKSIASLNLNRVSGASLTTQGFDNAIEQIRQQAKS